MNNSLEVVSDRDAEPRRPQLRRRPRRVARSSSTRSATSTGSRQILDERGWTRVARARDALPQRLRQRWARARPHARRGVRRAERHGHRVRRAPGQRQGRARGRRRTHPRAPHARPHPEPPLVRRQRRRRGPRAVHRRLPAVRQRRPPRPARPGADRAAGPRAVAVHAADRATRSPARRSVYPTHGFGSFCSATATVGTASTRRRADREQPGVRGRRGDLRHRAHRRPRRLPGLLRAHGSGQPGRSRPDRPVPARRSRPPPTSQRASRAASGSSTCATVASSPPTTSRGSLSFDVHGNAITYLGWLIDWGTPITLLGADADEVAVDAARARAHRHRPARRRTPSARPLDWASAAAPRSSYRRATARRDGRRRSRRTRASPCSTCDATASTTTASSPAPSTCRCTSCAAGSTRSSRWAADNADARTGLALLRQRVPGLGRCLDPRGGGRVARPCRRRLPERREGRPPDLAPRGAVTASAPPTPTDACSAVIPTDRAG